MSRRCIVFDLDDLIVPTAEFVIKRHRAETGIAVPLGAYYTATPEEWGLDDHNEVTRVLNGYLEGDAYMQLGSRLEARRAIARLAYDPGLFSELESILND